MSTVTSPPAAVKIGRPPAAVELHGVSWETYLALVDEIDSPGARLTYDEGVLEIMSPSYEHDHSKRLLGRLVEAYTEELDIDIESAGTTTLKQHELKKGTEADESYYIANAALMQGADEIDLAQVPPPDLAIEIDISRSSERKQNVYSQIGVPEIWRCDGERIGVFLLEADGSYAPAERSRALPDLPIAELERFLAMQGSLSETKLVRAFRQWVRENCS